MGYFSNQTEADAYEAKWCSCCENNTGDGCTIMLAHLVYNYDECNNPESILHLLIPREVNGGNKKCGMYRGPMF